MDGACTIKDLVTEFGVSRAAVSAIIITLGIPTKRIGPAIVVDADGLKKLTPALRALRRERIANPYHKPKSAS